MTEQIQSPARTVEQNHRHSAVGPHHRQHRVSVPGGELTVGIWGPEESGPQVPTVLAVHGVSASHRSFGLLAQELPGVRVIAPDLRGRGRSNGLPGPYGMPVHADDLAAVLHELGAGPVVVVGHSMGAFVTLVLADRHPDLVASAVLVDGGIPLKVPEGLDPDQVVQAILGPAAERLAMTFSGVDQYRGFWRQHPAFQGPWTELLEDYITYDLDPVDPGAGEDGLFRPATRYEAMAQDTAELQGGGSLLQALDALRVPTRLLWSRRGLFHEEPGLYTPEYLSDWQERVPALGRSLSADEVPDTNHYTILMDQDGARAVARTVRAQLARTPQDTRAGE